MDLKNENDKEDGGDTTVDDPYPGHHFESISSPGFRLPCFLGKGRDIQGVGPIFLTKDSESLWRQQVWDNQLFPVGPLQNTKDLWVVFHEG